MTTRKSLIDPTKAIKPEVFKDEVILACDKVLTALKVVWEEAGYENAECDSLLNELLLKVTSNLENELTSEKKILEHAKDQIALKLSRYNELCAQLGRVGKSDNELGSNCASKFSSLEKLLEVIEVEVDERESVIEKEYNKILEICTCLGEEILPLSSYEAPEGFPPLSDARVEMLQEVYSIYFQMKKDRMDEMKKIASQCIDIMKEMEIAKEGWGSLSSTYLNDCNISLLKFMQNGDWTMGYHTEDVKILNFRFDSLKDEKEKRKHELATVGAEIARLWTLLRIPTSEREAFQNSFKLNLSQETIMKGRQEHERLLIVRKTSLKRVISSIRKDILSLWEEAGIENEEQQKNELPIYFNDLEKMEDEAVEIHETYFTKLKGRVDELKPILTKIARREAIIQERVELEHIQLNPERLIARGPNAREERKREEGMTNRVKNLDKITRELLGNIATWEETHGPFLFAGERYIDRVNKQEENYVEIRDTLRNARRKKDVPVKPESFNSKGSKKIVTYQATSFTPSSTPRKEMPVNESFAEPISLANRDENYSSSARNRSNSHGSDCTNYTSVTEVRERASSVTVTKLP